MLFYPAEDVPVGLLAVGLVQYLMAAAVYELQRHIGHACGGKPCSHLAHALAKAADGVLVTAYKKHRQVGGEHSRPLVRADLGKHRKQLAVRRGGKGEGAVFIDVVFFNDLRVARKPCVGVTALAAMLEIAGKGEPFKQSAAVTHAAESNYQIGKRQRDAGGRAAPRRAHYHGGVNILGIFRKEKTRHE